MAISEPVLQPRRGEGEAAAGAGISGVRAATVYVDDLDRALGFYVGTLGFEQRSDAGGLGPLRLAEVAPRGARTALVLVQPSLSAMGVERASIARQRIGEPTGLVLETEDIETTYAQLRARSVQFAGPPARDERGTSATSFRDPDGNEFLLVERPHAADPTGDR